MNPNKKNLHEKLDWNVVQAEMKKKIGSDIFDSWLKNLSKNLIIMFYSLSVQGSLEIGLHQDI